MSCSAVGSLRAVLDLQYPTIQNILEEQEFLPPDARSLPCQVVNLDVLFLSTEGSTVKHIQRPERRAWNEQGTATVGQPAPVSWNCLCLGGLLCLQPSRCENER